MTKRAFASKIEFNVPDWLRQLCSKLFPGLSRPAVRLAPRWRPRIEVLEDRTVPVTITAGADNSLTDNDFTRIANAVASATTGETINLSGTFNWTAPFAAAAYAASNSTSATQDICGVMLPGGIDDLTITSTNSDAQIIGMGDFQAGIYDSFLFAEDGPSSVGNTNLTISNLNIDNFENAVMLGWNSTGTFNGTKIENNTITVAGDNFDTQNIAVYLWVGQNQQMTGNTIDFDADGTNDISADSFGFQNGPADGTSYDGLLIDNNTFQLLPSATGQEVVYGIWYSGQDDGSAQISITHNQFKGLQGVDDFNNALVLSSQSANLLIDSNTFTDVDNVVDIEDFANPSAGEQYTLSNNVLTRVGGADGIFLHNVTVNDIDVGINWNINNTIDGETGIRGLNELSTQATQESRPDGAASDLDTVIAEGIKNPVFVDDSWAGADRFTDPDGIGTGAGPVAFGFNGFATIQDGIDAVDDGGTVRVETATYPENVVVNKSITLQGATGVATDVVVDPATGDGITIAASNVTVSGLRVTGAANGISADSVSDLTLSNLQFDANSAAGLSATNIGGTLTLADLTVLGNGSGGTFSGTGASTLDFTGTTTGVIADAITVTASQLQHTRVSNVQQALGYSGFATMNLRGNDGNDTFDISPSATTTINVFGGTPTVSPGDTLIYEDPGIPFFATPSHSDGNVSQTGFQNVVFTGIETLNINGNHPPIQTAPHDALGNPLPLTAINVKEDSADTAAVTLGLPSTLAYGPGGGSNEAGQTLTYTITAIPSFITLFKANGTQVLPNTTLTLADLRLLKYKTVANANGTGIVTWKVKDNGGTANGSVDTLFVNLSVTVLSVNDAPSGISKTVSTVLNTPYVFTVADFGYADSLDTPANNLLAVKIVTFTLPAGATLTDNGVAVVKGAFVSVSDISGGLLVFTPKAGGKGISYAKFTFQVEDDGGTANGGKNLDATAKTITINVRALPDHAPSGANKTVTILEDKPYVFAVANFGFSDLTDTPHDALLAVKITTLPGAGLLTLGGVAVNSGDLILATAITAGKLKFTPGANGNGIGYASFTFQVQDNGGTSAGGVDLDPTPKTFTFNVTPVNDAPVRTAGTLTPIGISANSANSVAAALGLPSNLAYGPGGGSDESGQTLTIKITAIPSTSFLRLYKSDGTTPITLNTTLTLADLLGLTYKTIANKRGTGTLSWSVTDNGGVANGGANTLTQSLTITVS